MAKVSPVSIKYMIKAKFSAVGAVEKPDVIGALFGQTEGLLGSDLEMRELQKEGKIGRIEVNLETREGKTQGDIEIPSALDKAETTLIAAAIETIERIGPTDAKIEVSGVEDVRGNKREYIMERAKKLLEQIEGKNLESKEFGQALKDSARTSKIQEYGEERLPAGDISGDEVVVVEGRADVVNLLKYGVSNVIGMNGTNLPKSIGELSKEKKLTLFIDGDRGGKLIAKNVADNARLEYVAVAPDGKEVEELTGKEILMCLRKKIPAEEFFGERKRTARREERQETREKPQERSAELTGKEKEKLQTMSEEIEGTKRAYLLDSNLEIVRKTPLNDLGFILQRNRVFAIVADGTATLGMVRAAEYAGCKIFVAKNFATAETSMKLLSF